MASKGVRLVRMLTGCSDGCLGSDVVANLGPIWGPQAFLALQLSAGLGVLVQLNPYSMVLGASSLVSVVATPRRRSGPLYSFILVD